MVNVNKVLLGLLLLVAFFGGGLGYTLTKDKDKDWFGVAGCAMIVIGGLHWFLLKKKQKTPAP